MAAVVKENQSESVHSETYETLMQVSWNFDYQGQVAKLDDLYNRAKENQWNAAELAWDTPIDPSNPIIAVEHSQYGKMPFFRSSLKSSSRPSWPTPPRRCFRSFCTVSRARC